MITLDSISKKIGSRILFEDVSITFTKNRYGLTGPNGAGKSTLMKIIHKDEEPTSGTIVLPKKVGFLRQNIEEYKDFLVRDVVIMGNTKLWSALSERDELYQQEITDEVGMRLGSIEEIIADENGYTADADAEILLNGMGIDSANFEKKMHSLPTDQQFKVLLCQALFGEPEALLLDEPTNHLDLQSIRWLENFLHQYEGCLIVISHDRHFLNAICTHIADIDYETIITYPGNYDQMLVAKSSVRKRIEEENKAKEQKVKKLNEFVAKFSAGTRASQVQSRLRELDRLQSQELKQSNIQRPYIRFPSPEKQPGQITLKAEHLAKAYDEPVIRDFSIEILRGEKIAVIGNNGLGKTTLLKLLAKELTPKKGHVNYGHNIELCYFPQNHEEAVDKSSSITLFDWLKDQREGLYDQDVRGALGKMLFGGDDAFKQVRHLSGGETARLLLAGMMLKAPNTVILDEPNNHLDLESVSALAIGLESFPGTAIVASHDRDLVNRFATKLIAFEKDEIHIFDGTLDEYLEKALV